MRAQGESPVQRFHRDPCNGKLMGVCAGLADYFGCNVAFIRILAIVALVWFNLLTLVVYLLLGFMLPARSDRLHDGDTEGEYWRSDKRSADEPFCDVRHRFRGLDMKLQRMESYVTSSRYDLERQFRDLEH